MRLAELAVRSGPPLADGLPDPDIRGLCSDSRSLRHGELFAALPGDRTDGSRFLQQAFRRGAAAALVAPDAERHAREIGLATVVDPRPRQRLARMAAVFYEAQPDMVVAVTGTNGKTSTAHFLAELWRHSGRRAATIGTLGVGVNGDRRPPDGVPCLTTPDPVALHAELASLSRAGFDHAVLEASSHGLHQHRLDGVRIAVGILTSIGRDHLDYHGTEAAYHAAKRRLFSELVESGGTAVFNAAHVDPCTLEAARNRTLNIVTYGWPDGACWQALATETESGNQRLRIRTPAGEASVRFAPRGAFQAENALAAAAAAVASGLSVDDTVAGLAALTAPAGRLEEVAVHEGARVFVDYAHTPDALAAALEALRPHTPGKLHVVFGCGGDRDRGKRRSMGAVAARHADRVIITDDNPRSEDPAAIRAEAKQDAPDAREIGDRLEAIAAGIAALEAGDTLLVAGKGHETTQVVGGEATPFDDRAVVRRLTQRDDA